MWAFVLRLFGSSIGKYVIYGIAGLIAAGVFTGLYIDWKHGIEENAVQKIKIEQLESDLASKEKLIVQQRAVMAIQAASSKELTDQVDSLNAKATELELWISSPNAMKNDRPSSKILKETIKRLGE